MSYVDYYVRYRIVNDAADEVERKMKKLQKSLNKLNKNIVLLNKQVKGLLGGV